MDDDLKRAWKIIEERRNELSEKERNCILCDNKTHRLVVIIPEDRSTFGLPKSEEHARLAFVPVCEAHDTDHPSVQKDINKVVRIWLQGWKN